MQQDTNDWFNFKETGEIDILETFFSTPDAWRMAAYGWNGSSGQELTLKKCSHCLSGQEEAALFLMTVRSASSPLLVQSTWIWRHWLCLETFFPYALVLQLRMWTADFACLALGVCFLGFPQSFLPEGIKALACLWRICPPWYGEGWNTNFGRILVQIN